VSEPPRPPEVKALAKRALFQNLDGKLCAAGYAVPAPVAAPPPPALSFEAWAELSVRLIDASPEVLAATLTARSLTVAVWRRLEHEYLHMLRHDASAGGRERSALYEALNKEEMARRRAAAGTPPALPVPAPAAMSGTALAPDLGAATWEATGRMPFVPPPPEVLVDGKRPAKTVPSKAVPDRVSSGTMGLDPAQQRPTPTLPFAGSNGSVGVGYEASLDARKYVALCAELVLGPTPLLDTLRRSEVPTVSALRMLEEHWRHPARRAELESALAELAAVVRRRALG
jgi:hypothetical protein